VKAYAALPTKLTVPKRVFQNFIFMGDFNAGCSYVPKKAWKNIRLRTDPGFVWLIGDQEDTTVKKSTNCAYDRSEASVGAASHAVLGGH
jgi:hypothetical protein